MSREFVLVRAWMGFTSATFFQSHKLSAKANQATRDQMIDSSTIPLQWIQILWALGRSIPLGEMGDS